MYFFHGFNGHIDVILILMSSLLNQVNYKFMKKNILCVILCIDVLNILYLILS